MLHSTILVGRLNDGPERDWHEVTLHFEPKDHVKYAACMELGRE